MVLTAITNPRCWLAMAITSSGVVMAEFLEVAAPKCEGRGIVGHGTARLGRRWRGTKGVRSTLPHTQRAPRNEKVVPRGKTAEG